MDQASDALSESPAQPIPDYSRLTRDDIEQIRLLLAAGLTQAEIAERLQCSQPTVSKWAQVLIHPVESAKHHLQNAALEMTDAVIKGVVKAASKGKLEHGLEVLDRIGVAEKREKSTGTAVQVNVGVSLG